MKKFGIVISMIALVFLAAMVCVAAQNFGAEKIVLDGGTRGNIDFPHKQHQVALEDCQACHDIFPQEPGAIAKLIAAGELQKKKVMNIKCVKCHKLRQNDGRKAGPVKCTGCHIKEEK